MDAGCFHYACYLCQVFAILGPYYRGASAVPAELGLVRSMRSHMNPELTIERRGDLTSVAQGVAEATRRREVRKSQAQPRSSWSSQWQGTPLAWELGGVKPALFAMIRWRAHWCGRVRIYEDARRQ